MKDYIIAVSSTSDLSKDWLDAHHIPMLSYSFELDGEIIEDDCTAQVRHRLYSKMRQGVMPRTSAINVSGYYDFFRKLLSSGKDVLYLDMCSALSSSYQNSITAMEMVRSEFPDQQIDVIDTRCVTIGLALLIQHCVKLHEEGKSYEEVRSFAEENKMRIAHRFTINDLKWLAKGGRLSNASAVVGSILSIKPMIYVDDEGKLIASSKVHGRRKAVRTLVEAIGKDVPDTKGLELILSHSDCPADCEAMKQEIIRTYPDIGPIQIMELGPTIGAHTGPDFLAVVYFDSRRRP